ncbi:MAG: hypothetical protein IT448_07955 [Phycisphaerales bacterium]|nr:hypothetical protein [Phycisphaerales bacterium]
MAMIGFIQNILRRLPGRTRRTHRRPRTNTTIARSLIGQSKQEVLQKLGIPRSATAEHAICPNNPNSALFWCATTWYYPFDTAQRTAMAIHFRRDLVGWIELIHTAEYVAQAA